MVPPEKGLHKREGVWRENLAVFLGPVLLELFQVSHEDIVDCQRVQARVCWHVRAAIGRVGRNNKHKAALRAAFNVEHDAEIIQAATTRERLDINYKRGGLSPSSTNSHLSEHYVEELAAVLTRPGPQQPTDEELREEVRLHAECARRIKHERLAGGPEPAAWHVESPRDQRAAELWLPNTLLHFAVTPVKALITIPTSNMRELPAFIEEDQHFLPAFTDERLYQQFWLDHPGPTVRWRKFGRQVLAVLHKQGGLGLAVNQLANGTQDGWYWTAKELRDL